MIYSTYALMSDVSPVLISNMKRHTGETTGQIDALDILENVGLEESITVIDHSPVNIDKTRANIALDWVEGYKWLWGNDDRIDRLLYVTRLWLNFEEQEQRVDYCGEPILGGFGIATVEMELDSFVSKVAAIDDTSPEKFNIESWVESGYPQDTPQRGGQFIIPGVTLHDPDMSSMEPSGYSSWESFSVSEDPAILYDKLTKSREKMEYTQGSSYWHKIIKVIETDPHKKIASKKIGASAIAACEMALYGGGSLIMIAEYINRACRNEETYLRMAGLGKAARYRTLMRGTSTAYPVAEWDTEQILKAGFEKRDELYANIGYLNSFTEGTGIFNPQRRTALELDIRKQVRNARNAKAQELGSAYLTEYDSISLSNNLGTLMRGYLV